MNQPFHRRMAASGATGGGDEGDFGPATTAGRTDLHRSDSEVGRNQAYPWRRPWAKTTETGRHPVTLFVTNLL
jgi:hypothetical protein